MKLAALDPKFNLTECVSPADTRLPSDWTISTSHWIQGQKGLSFALGVNNVFDREPPLIVRNTAAGGGPVNGNTYPEWYDRARPLLFCQRYDEFPALRRFMISARPPIAACSRSARRVGQKSGRCPVASNI